MIPCFKKIQKICFSVRKLCFSIFSKEMFFYSLVSRFGGGLGGRGWTPPGGRHGWNCFFLTRSMFSKKGISQVSLLYLYMFALCLYYFLVLSGCLKILLVAFCLSTSSSGPPPPARETIYYMYRASGFMN